MFFLFVLVYFVSLLNHNAPGHKNTRTLETGDKMLDNIWNWKIFIEILSRKECSMHYCECPMTSSSTRIWNVLPVYNIIKVEIASDDESKR